MESTTGLVLSYTNVTNLHPIFALLLFIAIMLTLFSKKRTPTIAAFLIIINFVTEAQRLSLSGIDFPLYRLMLVVIFIRIILRKEYIWFQPTKLDRWVLIQVLVVTIASMLRRPSFSTFAYVVSIMIDSLGTYFMVRILIRDYRELKSSVVVMMWISFSMAALFIVERFTGRNPMAIFGAVAATTWVRGGKMRVQGPYPHVILAGAYWAMNIPLFIAASSERGTKKPLMILAAICGITIVVLCSSSTPLVSLMVGLAAVVLYYQRNITNRLKIVMLAAICGLMLYWNKPIWFLLSRIDFTGGSTGYFRYFLIDSFVRHWKEWILIGTKTTANWGEGLVDVCNQYVATGTNGGLLSLIAFITAIMFAFKYVGALVVESTDDDERRWYWSLGVSVLVHLFNFIGVSYYAQLVPTWYFTLALCASMFQCMVLNKESLNASDRPLLGSGPMSQRARA
jgi:hypothetical protein